MLAARDLAIGYGRSLVGRDLNLSLAKGEVLALLGPNGGGKTTLLKTLLGLLPPLQGTVELDGRGLHRLSDRERARAIGYVPQTHAATFAFSVETIVLMGRTARGSLFRPPSATDRDVARRMLERFGIATLAQRPYTMISGG